MPSRLKSYFAGPQSTDTEQDVEHDGPYNGSSDVDNKHVANTTQQALKDSDLEGTPSQDVPHGIQAAEAITLTWTKNQLIVTYIFVFICNFVISLMQQMANSLSPYVLSDFAAHELVATVGVVSYIMGGVLQIPTAKVLDIWGRAEGLAIMCAISTLGIILTAACEDVRTYAASQVFYGIGNTGMLYVLSIIVADTSRLQNRALAFAFMSCPYIATTFAGPSLAQQFLDHSSFRWGYGMFAIVIPVVVLPVVGVLHYNQQKAKKQGLLQKQASGRTWAQSTLHYLVEFDAIGVLFLCAGLVMFLLPFSLAGSTAETWRSATNITLIILGPLFILAFVLWEAYGARQPYIPYPLFLSRSVIGANILSAVLFIGYYCWDGYYTSYLQVVFNVSISSAGYIGNIYSIGSCFWALVVGFLIKWSGRYKWLAWVFMPIQCLGGGLMIYFRRPGQNIGYVVMCQIFIAFAGGTLVICEEMAVMAVAKHGEVAVLLAILALSAAVGAGIGSSVSGAIWQNSLPRLLEEYLPEAYKANATEIYNDLDLQLSFEMGSPVRDAIIDAYGVAQQRMCIAGTSILVLGFVGIALWKDVHIKNFKQTKGLVL